MCMVITMFRSINDWFKEAMRFDGIQDYELSDGSDWIWLTPIERLGVQSQDDFDVAQRLISDRKLAAARTLADGCSAVEQRAPIAHTLARGDESARALT